MALHAPLNTTHPGGWTSSNALKAAVASPAQDRVGDAGGASTRSAALTVFPNRHIPALGMQKPRLIEVYDCLCDETRLRMVHLLAQSPLCVCHLQAILGLTQVATSKHLGYLRRRGLVESRRHEQWVIYSLPVERPRELDWQLRCLQDCLPTHPVFRNDLRALKARRSECGWVAGALGSTTPTRPTSGIQTNAS